jgi:phage terminase small subunit
MRKGADRRLEGASARLTPKQERFVGENVKDLDATNAARRAGYSPKSANVVGPRLFTIPAVSAAIAASKAVRAKRLELKADQVFQELSRVAFSEARDPFDETGRLKAVQTLDDDTARNVPGLDRAVAGPSANVRRKSGARSLRRTLSKTARIATNHMARRFG